MPGDEVPKDTTKMVHETLVALGRREPEPEPLKVTIVLDPKCRCRGTGKVWMLRDDGRKEWSEEQTCRCVTEQIEAAVTKVKGC